MPKMKTLFKFYISKSDGEGLSKYLLRNSRRSIKDIMESVLPGYYDSIYASLCKFTHGDIFAQTIFRSNVSAKDYTTTNIKNIFQNGFIMFQIKLYLSFPALLICMIRFSLIILYLKIRHC